MQPTRLLTILFLLGLILTIVLSDSTWFDMDDDDNSAISKRNIFHHHRHHSDSDSDLSQPRQCVRCKFSLFRCCYPNICVKRRFRMDKCLRVKS
jgi:hypothetical protein